MPKKVGVEKVVAETSLTAKYSFRSKRNDTASRVVNEEVEKVKDPEPKVEETNTEIRDKEQKGGSSDGGKSKRPKVKVEFDEDNYGIESVKKAKWVPKNWEQTLKNIREMRKTNDAPVDTMGCHMCKDEKASPEVQRYQTLIALMLSPQTKDQITHGAMQRLMEHGLTVDHMLETDDKTLEKLIFPVGFWRRKAQNIKKVTEILKSEYNSDIPNNIDQLCELPGIGPKIAHLAMNCGWGIVTGIGVDTHVHRISNRIGWVSKITKSPEQTRKELEAWLPADLWKEVNHLLVGFGQQVCLPVKPQCSTCLNAPICPTSKEFLTRYK